MVSAGAGFSRAGGTCPTTTGNVAAGGNCTIGVRFTPASVGVKTGTVTINDDASNGSPQTVNLTGEGVLQLPISSVTPASFDFGNVQTAIAAASAPTRDITVSNTGTGTIPMNVAIAVTGTGFTRITTVAGNCTTTLAAGASCTIRVRFLPTTGGAKTGNVRITTNSNNVAGTVQNVPLTGNATIVANNDATSVLAVGNLGLVTTSFNVRGNDVPANAGTVAITSSSFTNGGATAAASVNLTTNQVVWTTTGVGANSTARALSRRGTYTVVYTLTNGTATTTATYVLTLI